MTKKIYKTSRGRTIDMGALILQNESVRAVGNMNVNARGDLLDGADRVIDTKNSQIRRQNERQTRANVPTREVHTGTREAKQAVQKKQPEVVETVLDTPPLVEATPSSGLGAAMARSRQLNNDEPQ
jgi:hypothetical protein